MKPTSTSLLLCSIATFVSLSFAQSTVGPMVNGTGVCTLECPTEKPDCPSGLVPIGRESCWGCCQPTNPVTVETATTATTPTADVCAQEICHADPPRCQAGWQPKGVEGCWTQCCTQGSLTQTGSIGSPTSGPANSTVLTTATDTSTVPGSQTPAGGSMQLKAAGGVMLILPSLLLGVWVL